MAENSNNNINITKEDLKELITSAVAAAVAAVKAPTAEEQRVLDAEKKRIETDQANRLKTADSVKQDIANKKWTHLNCSHEHKNGDTHCVYVAERVGPGYLLCQKNQCIIRPGTPSKNYKGTVVYNTDLFNKIFQKLPGGEIFG
jgi:hypothetical protein